jgi:hypothetical protein
MTSNTACVRAIGREAHEAIHREGAQRAEGVFLPGLARAGEHRFHRQLLALAQRVEQVRLVAEVPVDGAARDACGRCHLCERRVCDAALAEYPCRGVEQLLARGGGLGFRASCHS